MFYCMSNFSRLLTRTQQTLLAGQSDIVDIDIMNMCCRHAFENRCPPSLCMNLQWWCLNSPRTEIKVFGLEAFIYKIIFENFLRKIWSCWLKTGVTEDPVHSILPTPCLQAVGNPRVFIFAKVVTRPCIFLPISGWVCGKEVAPHSWDSVTSIIYFVRLRGTESISYDHIFFS